MSFLVFSIIFFNIVLCSLVLARNVRNTLNRSLFFFGLTQIAWVFFLFLADSRSDFTLWYLRFALTAAMMMGLSGIALSRSFGVRLPNIARKISLIAQSCALVAASLALSPFLIRGFDRDSNGLAQPIFSPTLFAIYLLFTVVVFWTVILNYVLSLKKAAKIQRQQILNVGYGIFIFGISGILINLVFPEFIEGFQPSYFGQLTTLFFLAFIFNAIARYRFLDFRPVLIRSVIYSISIIALTFLNAVFIYLITALTAATSANVVSRFEYLFPIIIVNSLSFYPLKNYFDAKTRKFFFRDTYDTQELLDSLNKILISNIEIDDLLNNVSQLISDRVKIDYCIFSLVQTDKDKRRIFGNHDNLERKFLSTALDEIAIRISKNKKTIITDELEQKSIEFQADLRGEDIAVIIGLNGVQYGDKGTGFILLGNKKSGSPYSRQDIKVLEIIADEMVIAIQNALRFEEIENFANTLQQKVNEATTKLRHTNEKLKEMDEIKDDFISMASHQLRTPLTAVKGYISMVLEGDAGRLSATQRNMLDQSFVSSQRMVYLIADLLNVSRLKTGKFVLQPIATNLAEITDGEIAQLRETAKSRNIDLTYDKPAKFPQLMLDETKIRQVIMNFIDNSVYYTPPGGHVQVAVEDKPETVEFTVTDDGIGIPQAEQHRLFNKFYRASNAKKTRPDGTGLGLFMAKKVVIAHGGSIIFKSQVGKGSTFGFTFAKAPLQPPALQGPSLKKAKS